VEAKEALLDDREKRGTHGEQRLVPKRATAVSVWRFPTQSKPGVGVSPQDVGRNRLCLTAAHFEPFVTFDASQSVRSLQR